VRAKRLFVSLDLPETIVHLLGELDPHVSGVRWVSPEQMHLTLAFFGNVESELEEKLRNQLESISFKSFFLPLQGFGTFPARGRLTVVWLGVGRGHPHLFQLHKKVADAALAAGLEPDLRPWHPHIALARCKRVSASAVRPFLREHAETDLGLVPIDRFHLKSSRLTPAGSIYTDELTVCAQ
jgi:RNA 2',3'-cyclic 3'-phosphodiesterase